MLRWAFLFTIILSFQNTFAMDHQKEIKQAQLWADSFETPYPVLVMDRDEMNFLFASQNLLGKEKFDERIQFLEKYILAKTGVALNKGELENLEVYLTQYTSSAVAQPTLKNLGSSSEYKLCTVFSNPPNGNARIESERMIGLGFDEVYKHESYEKLTKKMTFEELYLFSLYHEVSHCLDPLFMPKMYQHSDDSHSVHLSEAFAETMAYLTLNERLGAKVADARSLYRAVYSRKMGEFFAQEEGGGFFNPHRKNGGIIYYLTPYLLNSFQKIRFKKVTVNLSQPQNVLELAVNLVNSNSFKSREFTAIRLGLTNGFDATLKKYGDMAYDDPEYFYDAYLKLVDYTSLTDFWLSRAFSMEEPSNEAELESLPKLSLSKICEVIRAGDSEQFYEILSEERSLMHSKQFNPASLQTRYEDLNNLNGLLKKNCEIEMAKP